MRDWLERLARGQPAVLAARRNADHNTIEAITYEGVIMIESAHVPSSDRAELDRRRLRRVCWIGCLLVLVAFVSVFGPSLSVRWRLQQHGWEIGDREFGGSRLRSSLRKLHSQWFAPVEHLWLEDKPFQYGDVELLRSFATTKQIYFNGSAVPEQATRQFVEFANLERLTFFDVVLDPAGIEHLGKCRSLKTLNFGYMRVDESSLVHLEKLPNLTEFRHHETGAKGLQHIANFVNLESLEIDDGRFADADLASLARLTKLRRLWLGDCPVTDEGARILVDSCPNLTELNLRGDQLTDGAMAHLARHPTLEFLTLDDQPISDVGLRELKTSARLKRVGIRDSKVTSTGIEELKRANPKIEVYP